MKHCRFKLMPSYYLRDESKQIKKTYIQPKFSIHQFTYIYTVFIDQVIMMFDLKQQLLSRAIAAVH